MTLVKIKIAVLVDKGGSYWKEIDAEFAFSKYGFDFFIARNFINHTWEIHERTTGFLVYSGGELSKSATITEAKKMLKKYGQIKTINHIIKANNRLKELNLI